MPSIPIEEYLKPAREQAQQAQQQAVRLGANLYTVPQQLREVLTEKMKANRDLVQAQREAEAQYLATPARARAEYIRPITAENYLPPQQVEALVAQEKAQAYAPYATLTDVLGQRTGRAEDILQAATGGFQAQAAAAQGAAQIAQNAYQMLLQEYTAGADIELRQEALGLERERFGEQKRQFGLTFDEQQRQFNEQMRVSAEQWADQQAATKWQQNYTMARDKTLDEQYAREYADKIAIQQWEQDYKDRLYQLQQLQTQYEISRPYTTGAATTLTPAQQSDIAFEKANALGDFYVEVQGAGSREEALKRLNARMPQFSLIGISREQGENTINALYPSQGEGAGGVKRDIFGNLKSLLGKVQLPAVQQPSVVSPFTEYRGPSPFSPTQTTPSVTPDYVGRARDYLKSLISR